MSFFGHPAGDHENEFKRTEELIEPFFVKITNNNERVKIKHEQAQHLKKYVLNIKRDERCRITHLGTAIKFMIFLR